MHFTRCVLAEWPLLRARLVRSRLGLWLALLALGLVLAEQYAPSPDPLTTALDAGALGATLSVGYLAGSAADRRALCLLLAQPTTPAAVACGRWLSAVGGAALVVVTVGVHSAWTSGTVRASVGAIMAGLVAAAAVAASGLALAWFGGNLLVGCMFAGLALFGHLSPEGILGTLHPGMLRLMGATAVAVFPLPVHYRGVAWAHVGSVLHATAWVGLGIVLAATRAARLGHVTR